MSEEKSDTKTKATTKQASVKAKLIESVSKANPGQLVSVKRERLLEALSE